MNNTISCIWCGKEVHEESSCRVPFKKNIFLACSERCYRRTVQYLEAHERFSKLWGWIVIPLIILYGIITLSLMVGGFVSDHTVRLFGVSILLIGSIHLLVFPDLPKLKRPVPPRWRNIQSMVTIRAILGFLAAILAVVHYVF